MFSSLRKKFSGPFQQDPSYPTKRSSGPRLRSSPSRWSVVSTSGATTASATSGDDNPPSSSRNLDSVLEGKAPGRSPSYKTTASTSHLRPEQFVIDGSPNPPSAIAPPDAEAEEQTQTGARDRRRANTATAPPPRYVPYVDSFPLATMFASPDHGQPPNYYSNPNPSVMGGFGNHGLDPAPLYGWETMVDDESSGDDQPPPTQQGSDSQTQPSAPSEETSRRAFSYGAISADIMSDFNFPSPRPKELPTAIETTIASASSLHPHRGYQPIAASILEDFNMTPFSPQTTGGSTSTAASTPPAMSPPTRSRSSSKLLGSNNPYVALLEQKEQAMTVAFLRSQDAVPGSRSADLAADDFSFGQRYQQAADTTDVVVTRQRLPANDLGGSRECPICAETRDALSFPILSVTPTCTHPPEACLECLKMSIRSDLSSKLWTDIRCPECRELLEYVDIQKYADKETFARYEALALRAAMAEAENFIWCTANCGSGQLHDTGGDQPIVTCLHCGQRSCFTHSVAWHENLTCDEYDALLQDPENFRSRIEIENEEIDSARQAQEDADRAMAQGLMAEQQAEAQRREARERAERETARKAAALARKVAARRKAEEAQSRATLSRTTKACPGCGWAIEKNAGCSHMTCIKCRYEFCWGCNATWSRGHSVRCNGLLVPT